MEFEMDARETRISVVGIGNLGAALARVLLEAGGDLAVWNRTPGRVESLVEHGARAPATLEETLKHAEIVVFALASYEVAQAVFGTEIQSLSMQNKIVLNMGIGDAREARTVNALFTAGGAAYLEGNCGSYPTLVGSDNSACVYSGPREVFDRIKAPVVVPFGRDGAWVGEEIGAANALFVASSIFYVSSMTAHFEAAAYAHRHGITVDAYTDLSIKLLETLRDLITTSARHLNARDHTTIEQGTLEATLDAVKTLRGDATDVGARADLLGVTAQYLSEAVDAGYGKNEVSALFELLVHNQQHR
jgi:3-hydroxyisobutyrate dehydrogenase-like beta-hydroxyacid dehydrogenase